MLNHFLELVASTVQVIRRPDPDAEPGFGRTAAPTRVLLPAFPNTSCNEEAPFPMIALIVCLLLVALMVIGVPVCVAMGLTSAGAIAFMGLGWLLSTMAQKIYKGSVSYTLMAIPFFILAGNLMNYRRHHRPDLQLRQRDGRPLAGRAWTGERDVLSVIFSGMSGAAVADAAGLGIIEIKAMDDAGYDQKFSAGDHGGVVHHRPGHSAVHTRSWSIPR